MHIHIITVGENRQKYLLEVETEYLKRLGHYCKINITSVKGKKIKPNHPVEMIKEFEGNRIKRSLPQRGFVIALDKKGKQLSSEQMADMIADSFSTPAYWLRAKACVLSELTRLDLPP